MSILRNLLANETRPLAAGQQYRRPVQEESAIAPIATGPAPTSALAQSMFGKIDASWDARMAADAAAPSPLQSGFGSGFTPQTSGTIVSGNYVPQGSKPEQAAQQAAPSSWSGTATYGGEKHELGLRKGTSRVPGKGNSDTVPAMLTPGEAVLNKGAAKALGRDKIAKLNAKHASGKKTGFRGGALHASGGVVIDDFGNTVRPTPQAVPLDVNAANARLNYVGEQFGPQAATAEARTAAQGAGAMSPEMNIPNAGGAQQAPKVGFADRAKGAYNTVRDVVTGAGKPPPPSTMYQAGHGAARVANFARNVALPAAAAQAATQGFNDYNLGPQDIDHSVAGTAGYVLHGDYDKAKQSLQKGAVNAGADVASGLARAGDFVTGMFGKDPQYVGKLAQGIKDDIGQEAKDPEVIRARLFNKVNSGQELTKEEAALVPSILTGGKPAAAASSVEGSEDRVRKMAGEREAYKSPGQAPEQTAAAAAEVEKSRMGVEDFQKRTLVNRMRAEGSDPNAGLRALKDQSTANAFNELQGTRNSGVRLDVSKDGKRTFSGSRPAGYTDGWENTPEYKSAIERNAQMKRDNLAWKAGRGNVGAAIALDQISKASKEKADLMDAESKRTMNNAMADYYKVMPELQRSKYQREIYNTNLEKFDNTLKTMFTRADKEGKPVYDSGLAEEFMTELSKRGIDPGMVSQGQVYKELHPFMMGKGLTEQAKKLTSMFSPERSGRQTMVGGMQDGTFADVFAPGSNYGMINHMTSGFRKQLPGGQYAGKVVRMRDNDSGITGNYDLDQLAGGDPAKIAYILGQSKR